MSGWGMFFRCEIRHEKKGIQRFGPKDNQGEV
jgi:hypothetical protein